MDDTRYGTTLGTEFITLVSDDAKGVAVEEDRKVLRASSNLDDWYEALTALKRDTESQLAKRKADLSEFHQECLAAGPKGKGEYFAEKTRHERWRAGAVRFKLSIEGRIAEAKKLRRTLQPSMTSESKLEAINLLKWATCFIPPETPNGEEWYAAFYEFIKRQNGE